MGPVTAKEWRLIAISIASLLLWSTEKLLHPIDSSSIILLALAIMLLPKIGIMTWKEAESCIPWGTIIVFAP